MALIVGREHPRKVHSDEVGQTARMALYGIERKVEENARKAEERQKRLDAEAAKKKADLEAAQADKDTENENIKQAGHDDAHEPEAVAGDAKEEAAGPVRSSSVIDGSQIKLPKKKVARKPKTKK